MGWTAWVWNHLLEHLDGTRHILHGWTEAHHRRSKSLSHGHTKRPWPSSNDGLVQEWPPHQSCADQNLLPKDLEWDVGMLLNFRARAGVKAEKTGKRGKKMRQKCTGIRCFRRRARKIRTSILPASWWFSGSWVLFFKRHGFLCLSLEVWDSWGYLKQINFPPKSFGKDFCYFQTNKTKSRTEKEREDFCADQKEATGYVEKKKSHFYLKPSSHVDTKKSRSKNPEG